MFCDIFTDGLEPYGGYSVYHMNRVYSELIHLRVFLEEKYRQVKFLKI